MKPVIETEIFNTKEHDLSQIIVDLFILKEFIKDWAHQDSVVLSAIVKALRIIEENELPYQYEIKLFTGDVSKVKKPSDPKIFFYKGTLIAIKSRYLP